MTDLPADLTAELLAEADVAICGAGPIGAATATFLARPDLRVVLIDHDPADDPAHVATYRYAGGSIRWTWPDPVKREMTTHTEQFIRSAADGAELDMIENTYHLLHTGEHIPALNVSATGLVGMLRDQAQEAGATFVDALVTGVRPDGSGHVVETSRGAIRAGRVLGAMGAANSSVFPQVSAEPEKRQLFVLDLPVPPERELLPHTIVPVGDGFGYVFVKLIDGDLRVLVGQEDIVEDEDTSGPVDHWKEILDSGLAATLPWLRDARVDDILWGVDTAQKTLVLDEPSPGVLVANCGSAIRSAAWLGRTLADRLALEAG
ncbi:NAD(P)/FAD-dependent oxidoreductase [Nocardioides sp. NPDC051685]|uniref:NAD(P)/FAD-dependent oxidoreductase n=1 Tax=Nocardioides sp. NPDC051685 TaxID=3364334 RepID=UPI0037891D42